MTLEEIVESECAMFIDGEARYGRYFKHARAELSAIKAGVAAYVSSLWKSDGDGGV